MGRMLYIVTFVYAVGSFMPVLADKCKFGNLTVHITSEDPMDNNVMKRVIKITHKETV